MKLRNKLIIDFKVFFSKGQFDYLKIGQTKEWIIHNFPDPDGFDEIPEIYEDNIWTYGNIELHFSGQELFLIFSDYLHDLDGGDSLMLKKWFLETPNISLAKAIAALNQEHIDYQKTTKCYGQEVVVMLLLQGGVKLSFHLEQGEEESDSDFGKRCRNTSQNFYKLNSFSLM